MPVGFFIINAEMLFYLKDFILLRHLHAKSVFKYFSSSSVNELKSFFSTKLFMFSFASVLRKSVQNLPVWPMGLLRRSRKLNIVAGRWKKGAKVAGRSCRTKEKDVCPRRSFKTCCGPSVTFILTRRCLLKSLRSSKPVLKLRLKRNIVINPLINLPLWMFLFHGSSPEFLLLL